MHALYATHSGLRSLVLLVGFAGVVMCALGLIQKKPFSKAGRIMGSAFKGLVDLQVLLGLAMVAQGRFSGALIGHLVMMVAAAVVVHVFTFQNKRRAEPSWLMLMGAIGGAFALIVLGIGAIGRSPFQSIPFSG